MSYNYRFLTVEEIPEYVRSRPKLEGLVDLDNLATVNEIGDGNLNLVFILKDHDGRGLVVKQALPYVRMTGEGWPMTPERSFFEIGSLEIHGEIVPDLVVRILDTDPERFIFVMEDLSDHSVLRGAMNNGFRANNVASEVGRYVGACTFGTSVFGSERIAYGENRAKFVNPELSTITEDLVFTEPFVGAERNSYLDANAQDVRDFQADEAFGREMAYAKYIFMTQAETLLHGDLHTGSVMVREQDGSDISVKVFDSEFAFFGPPAFDIGAFWANLVIAAARAYALDDMERARFWLNEIESFWTAFESEFRKLWPNRRDPRLWDEAFLERLILRWKSESWLFAAAKMSRRIIGAAKTTDIETLEPSLREGAARGVLKVARKIAVSRHDSSSISDFIQIASTELEKSRTS